MYNILNNIYFLYVYTMNNDILSPNLMLTIYIYIYIYISIYTTIYYIYIEIK